MVRKIFSFIFILSLLIVPLFCCCHTEAVAATLGVEHCHDDADSHSANHDASKSDHDCSCNCGHELNAALENSSTLQADFSFGHNYYPEITVLIPKSITLLKGSVHLAYLGPPLGEAYVVPLYIQQHTIRI